MEDYKSKSPFNAFPYKHALQIIDKLEYLGEEASPYEISPGTDLCISDTYYTLGFFNYLHAFGKVVKDGEIWNLNPKGEPIPEKPYRYALIEDAVKILNVLHSGPKSLEKIADELPDFSKTEIEEYLNVLAALAQKGKVKQISKGWDATFALTEWTSND
ncbi:hypothetical protein [Candidatus Hodarchaeum mangrovi]